MFFSNVLNLSKHIIQRRQALGFLPLFWASWLGSDVGLGSPKRGGGFGKKNEVKEAKLVQGGTNLVSFFFQNH